MKTQIIVFSLFITLTLMSCKKEDKNEIKQEEVKDDVTKNQFKVTVDLLLKKNDTLHLYYTEDGSINFTEENSIWTSALGQNSNQEVVFLLPKDIVPTEFRIDFGVNTNQDEIILNQVRFDYNDKSFVASNDKIFNYFRIDESVTVLDSKTNGLRRKDPTQKKGASLYPLEIPVRSEIEKLFK